MQTSNNSGSCMSSPEISEKTCWEDGTAIAALEDGYPTSRVAFSALLEGVNVNSNTFLATDFLNNFNELIMMIAMLPDQPDLLEEIEEWQPLEYVEHFAHTGFPDRQLAIAGWYRADPKLRSAIERFVETTRDQLTGMLEEVNAGLIANDPGLFQQICENIGDTLTIAHDWVSALIQGQAGLDPDEIEQLLIYRKSALID